MPHKASSQWMVQGHPEGEEGMSLVLLQGLLIGQEYQPLLIQGNHPRRQTSGIKVTHFQYSEMPLMINTIKSLCFRNRTKLWNWRLAMEQKKKITKKMN